MVQRESSTPKLPAITTRDTSSPAHGVSLDHRPPSAASPATPSFNVDASSQLIVPLEVTVTIHTKEQSMNLTWQGPKTSMAESARASAEASAVASASLAHSLSADTPEVEAGNQISSTTHASNQESADTNTTSEMTPAQQQHMASPGLTLSQSLPASPSFVPASSPLLPLQMNCVLGTLRIPVHGVGVNMPAPTSRNPDLVIETHEAPAGAVVCLLKIKPEDPYTHLFEVERASGTAADIMEAKSGKRGKKKNKNAISPPAHESWVVTVKSKVIKNILTEMKAVRTVGLASFLFLAHTSTTEGSAQPDFYLNYLFSDYGAPHGTLSDMIASLRFPLPDSIKSSLVRDLAAGLTYLHSNRTFGSHGYLSDQMCIVDGGWRLRIIGFGLAFGDRRAKSNSTQSLHIVYATKADGSIPPDRLVFVAPERLKEFPNGKVTPEGDIFSAGILINMILGNGSRPYEEISDLSEIAVKLQSEAGAKFRPRLAKSNMLYQKVISQCWSHEPKSRPAAENLYQQLLAADTRSSTHYPTHHPTTTSRLIALFTSTLHRYLLELESAQSRLSSTLSDTLSIRLRDTEAKLAAARAEASRSVEVMRSGMQAEREKLIEKLEKLKSENATIQEQGDGQATHWRAKAEVAERELAVAMLMGLPGPLRDVVCAQWFQHREQGLHQHQTGVENTGGARQSIAAGMVQQNTYDPKLPKSTFALSSTATGLFPPTSYPSVTVMLISITGFNKLLGTGSEHPTNVIELLNEYYRALDEACINVSSNRHGSTINPRRVHVFERLCDTCVVVGGVPDRNETHAEDVVRVAELMMQWTGTLNKEFGLNDGKVSLKIGIHSGPVTAGILNPVQPKLAIMGETVNIATVIQSFDPAPEIRISKATYSLVVSKGYILDQRPDLDLRSKGKMEIFAVIATPYNKEM